MTTNELLVSTKYLIHWFNALRLVDPLQRTRALDAFWASQLESKAWLVNTLNTVVDCEGSKNVYIFGGWIGVLGNMLLTNSRFMVDKVVSVDIDPWCEQVATALNHEFASGSIKFQATTADMAVFDYDWDNYPHIVVNTSTEHITQELYDRWWDKIPTGTTVVLQGNNFFECSEHVRCSVNLVEFKRQNYATNPLFEGVLKTDSFDRYMCILSK